MEFLVHGPSYGHLQFTQVSTSREELFHHDETRVRRLGAKLAATIDAELTPLTSDWDYRGDDERSPVLKNLRDQGSELVEAMAGERGRQELVNVLSRIPHLICMNDDQLPWEFLYLGNPNAPASIHDFYGANAVMGRGSKGIIIENVNRVEPDRLIADKGPLSRLPPGLAITYHYAEDERLPSARDGSERAIFTSLGIKTTPLSVLSTSSARLSLQSFRDFLAQSEHLTHFNCHANPASTSTSGALYVSKEYEVDEAKLDTVRMRESSIVVLNCCKGHTMQHSLAPTIADCVMKSNVQAVVAATGKIDDHYATLWAGGFHRALHAGLTVPESILKTRRELFSRPKPNPAALFYAYLGQSQARLRARRAPGAMTKK